MSEKRLCVVGAVNADLLIEPDPNTGNDQYSIGRHFRTLVGGKGINTALSMAAMSADETGFVGRVGLDMYGDFIVRSIRQSHLRHYVLTDDRDRHTGIGHVRLRADGDYDTVVLPGANDGLDGADIDEYLAQYPDVSMWVTNLESPLRWLDRARQLKPEALIAINVSPINDMVSDALAVADLVVVNESEARQICGVNSSQSDESLIRQLAGLTKATVVVTLGGRGAIGLDSGRQIVSVEAVSVDVASTVGAGDAFFAAVCLAMSRDDGLHDALMLGAGAGGAVAAQGENYLTPETAPDFSRQVG